jgi:hypothetical protein
MNETSNGLGEYMALANLTVVGALIIVFVVGFFWTITRGFPRAFTLVSELIHSGRENEATSRKQFIDALEVQAVTRAEAAKGGHEAASRIADNLDDLTRELRRLMDDSPKSNAAGNGRKASIA